MTFSPRISGDTYLGNLDSSFDLLSYSRMFERMSIARYYCCAQQTGIGHVIVEALLNISNIVEGQPCTYRHKETFDRQIVLPVPYGLAGPA